MSAMTPEQLAGIQRRDKDAKQAAATGTVGTPPNVYGLTIHEALELINASAEDVPDLLAEVERLRAGIEALADEWRDSSANHPDCDGAEDCVGCAADELTDLLNPTEGESDERNRDA